MLISSSNNSISIHRNTRVSQLCLRTCTRPSKMLLDLLKHKPKLNSLKPKPLSRKPRFNRHRLLQRPRQGMEACPTPRSMHTGEDNVTTSKFSVSPHASAGLIFYVLRRNDLS